MEVSEKAVEVSNSLNSHLDHPGRKKKAGTLTQQSHQRMSTNANSVDWQCALLCSPAVRTVDVLFVQ